MKDLINLSNKHDLAPNLFYGDGIQRIYHLLEESKLTRWLDRTCDSDIDGEELWTRLIAFLEREFKVQH